MKCLTHGQLLREYIDRKGLQIGEVAGTLRVTRPTIYEWMRRIFLDEKLRNRILDAYKLPPDYFKAEVTNDETLPERYLCCMQNNELYRKANDRLKRINKQLVQKLRAAGKA